MSLLDRRHRWDAGRDVLMEARRVFTCTACGRTQSFEMLVPDGFLAEIAAFVAKPNPWRALFR